MAVYCPWVRLFSFIEELKVGWLGRIINGW